LKGRLVWIQFPRDRSDEAIAGARNGFNVAGRFRRVAERFAEFLNGFIQALIEVNENI
jgi:hypothetical protein